MTNFYTILQYEKPILLPPWIRPPPPLAGHGDVADAGRYGRGVAGAHRLDEHGDGQGEDHAHKDAGDEEEGCHHAGRALVLRLHVPGTTTCTLIVYARRV